MTTNGITSGDLLMCVLLMFAAYAFFLVIGIVISVDSTIFTRKVEWYIDRECETIKRIWLKIVNCYWLLRCIFLKRWWQYRRHYRLLANHGMSWEGNEKEYHKRYASAK